MNRPIITTIWIDGCLPVLVEGSVTDLDEAARILGYADYQDLLDANPVSTGDSPLNFIYEERS